MASEPIRTPRRGPVVNGQPTSVPLNQFPIRTPATLRASNKVFSTNQVNAIRNQKAMSDETKGYWVGPCPVPEFLESFLANNSRSTPPNISKTFFADKTVRKEEDLYVHFNEFVNKKKPARGYELRDTSLHHDPNSRHGSQVRPDGNLYENGVIKPGSHVNQMDKSSVPHEFKLGEELDILVEDDRSSYDPDAPLEATAEKRLQIRGQVVTYLVEMAARQHRTHIFMVFVFHPYVRLIRWDRAGIIVTKKFNYVEDCSLLTDFYWRYSQLSKAKQGFDPTVSLASEAETQHAHTYLAKWAPNGVERDVYKIKVPTTSNTGKTTYRNFLVWGALAEAASPLGRGTKGWPALEIKKGDWSDVPVFLKEQWRGKDVTKEVETLKLLNDNGVEHVPTLVCGGDLPGSFQTTVTHEYASKAWRLASDNPKKIETRIHVRLVTKEVGTPLECFQSSKDLLSAVRDAFQGHQQAYNKCGLLHRDVSGGNILILSGGRGLMNDWDLAIKITDLVEARTVERTGTWPFMSINLLANPSKLHTVRDDLESFIWVVLFYGLHYLENSLSVNPKELECKINEIFHQATYTPTLPRGGSNKAQLLDGNILDLSPESDTKFEFKTSPSLTAFIYDAIDVLATWKEDTRVARRRAPKDKDALWHADPLGKMHDDIKGIYDDALSETSPWPRNDAASYQLPPSKSAGFRISTKRKRVGPQDAGSSKRVKKSSS